MTEISMEFIGAIVWIFSVVWILLQLKILKTQRDEAIRDALDNAEIIKKMETHYKSALTSLVKTHQEAIECEQSKVNACVSLASIVAKTTTDLASEFSLDDSEIALHAAREFSQIAEHMEIICKLKL